MKIYILAWRNLWRNRRRTTITSASILFAVFFALVMRAFQLGFYDHMMKNAIESFSGFLQIQQEDYQYDQSFENTFVYDGSLTNNIFSHEEVKVAVPHLQAGALVSTGNYSKGAMIMGIDPEKEQGISDPAKRIVKYRFTSDLVDSMQQLDLPEKIKKRLKLIQYKSYTNANSIALDLEMDEKDTTKYLSSIRMISHYYGETIKPEDNGVLISDKLARYLKINPGDTLIILGQGYQGASAAGLYPVRGIVKIPNPELDSKLVYMTLAEAQYLFNMYDRVTSLAVNLHDNSKKNMLKVQKELNQDLKEDGLVVRNWTEFNKVLHQQIEGDNKSGKIMLGLLYFVIFFGIFGTVLMMIHERLRELGVMIAIGMHKVKLLRMFIYEMFFIGILGVMAGIVMSLPVLYFGHNNPIRLQGEMAQMIEDMGFEAVIPLSWVDTYVLWQGIVVTLMVVLSCLYPLRKIYQMKSVDALRT